MMEDYRSNESLKTTIIEKIINYIRGKNFSKPPAKTNLAVANTLDKYLVTKKGKSKALNEIDIITNKRIKLDFTGNPLDDWLSIIKIFSESCSQKNLISLRDDAKYVRLLHKGSTLRESLSASWRLNGHYKNAELLYKNAIQQENFSYTVKNLLEFML